MFKRKLSGNISSGKEPLKEKSDVKKVRHATRREDSSDERIDRANGLAVGEFQKHFIDEGHLEFRSKNSAITCTIQLCASFDLSSDALFSCFNLIETTSRKDYETSTSFGWHPRRKQREMKEPEMRYLLVRSTHQKNYSDGAIEGFLSFMLTHDSSPSVPVLYIYEIHLAESLRGCGLGGHLMHTAESIAERVRMDKVMLTCFLTNEKALAFYKARGYSKDECSPEDRETRNKVVKIDYVIMSKDVPK